MQRKHLVSFQLQLHQKMKFVFGFTPKILHHHLFLITLQFCVIIGSHHHLSYQQQRWICTKKTFHISSKKTLDICSKQTLDISLNCFVIHRWRHDSPPLYTTSSSLIFLVLCIFLKIWQQILSVGVPKNAADHHYHHHNHLKGKFLASLVDALLHFPINTMAQYLGLHPEQGELKVNSR